MSATYSPETFTFAAILAGEYDALVMARADANGVLHGSDAVRAAELAHELYKVLDYEAERYRLLSAEHREGQ